MPITVVFEASKQELRRAGRQLKFPMYLWLSIGFIVLGLVGAAMWSGGDAVGAFVVGYAVFSLVVIAITPGRVAAKAAAKGAGPTAIMFSEAGVGIRSALGTSQIRWEGIEKATELEDFFCIQASKRAVLIVPKRVFGPEEVGRMRALLAGAPMSGKRR